MHSFRFALILLILASFSACAKKSESSDKKPAPTPSIALDAGPRVEADAAPSTPPGEVALAPAAALAAVPAGLPAIPTTYTITPEEVALGELLFQEPRLGADGTTSCASCHDPARDHGGSEPHPQTAAGKPNLRRAPALSNLMWARELGWDGRSADPVTFLRSHAEGQLGQSLDDAAVKLAASPTYRAHLVRAGASRGRADTAIASLLAYVLTRFDGDAPWDHHEAGVVGAVSPDVVAGYELFTGKALCATCHPPPLYTDQSYHRLGLIASPDEGRGRVDPALPGAFKTPGLRGAARRSPQFHDGSAPQLDAAIDWHLGGGRGQGADPSVIDPGLRPVTLTPEERAQLGAFVRALTSSTPPEGKPVLPMDLP